MPELWEGLKWPLCGKDTLRLGPGAECPVCSTGQRVLELEGLVSTLTNLLSDEAVEWSTGPYRNRCPWCDEMHGTHRETCPQKAALKQVSQVFSPQYLQYLKEIKARP